MKDNVPKGLGRRLQPIKQSDTTVASLEVADFTVIGGHFCRRSHNVAYVRIVRVEPYVGDDVFDFLVDLPTAACPLAPMYPSSLLPASTLIFLTPVIAHRHIPILAGSLMGHESTMVFVTAPCAAKGPGSSAHPTRVLPEAVRQRELLLVGSVALFCAWSWRMDLETRMLTVSLLQRIRCECRSKLYV